MKAKIIPMASLIFTLCIIALLLVTSYSDLSDSSKLEQLVSEGGRLIYPIRHHAIRTVLDFTISIQGL